MKVTKKIKTEKILKHSSVVHTHRNHSENRRLHPGAMAEHFCECVCVCVFRRLHLSEPCVCRWAWQKNVVHCGSTCSESQSFQTYWNTFKEQTSPSPPPPPPPSLPQHLHAQCQAGQLLLKHTSCATRGSRPTCERAHGAVSDRCELTPFTRPAPSGHQMESESTSPPG